jgi:processive 1,2-diacylglycerol beta-glucosyltransferase
VATTDFGLHQLWVHRQCDRYFTATYEAVVYLYEHGIPTVTTSTTGIPIDPVFEVAKDRSACRPRHGLANARAVVLQLSGGFGVGPIEKYLRALLALPTPLQIVTIASRNERRVRLLQAVPVPPRHRLRVIGLTNDIDEYMAAADLVRSKTGGMTTVVTLARGAVMVIVNPTPGQECRNNDFLLENGVTIKVNNVEVLPAKVGDLLADEGRLRTLRANVRRLARPRAPPSTWPRSRWNSSASTRLAPTVWGRRSSPLDAARPPCDHDA